jgi:hypothetical protein
VTLTLTVTTNCIPATNRISSDPLPKTRQWVPPGGFGWTPLTEDGYHWIFRTEQGIQATCQYQYMRVQDVEMWKGTMHKMTTDFMSDQSVQESGLSNLSGCVDWVNHHLYGGYYL